MPQTPDVLSTLTTIETLLYAILWVLLLLIAVGVTWLVMTQRQLKVAVKTQESRQFQAQAAVLLAEAQYEQLKQVCTDRLEKRSGDALAHYYCGMAHFRSHEYVDAKRCFNTLVKLDATWKKVAASHLEAIEIALKKSKPVLVD
jgi:uncharacterized membrane protein YeiB